MTQMFSMGDLYPNYDRTASTTELTQEDDLVNNPNKDVSVNEKGRKTYTDTKLIMSALIFFIILTILVGFIK